MIVIKTFCKNYFQYNSIYGKELTLAIAVGFWKHWSYLEESVHFIVTCFEINNYKLQIICCYV
jgi:hypothetical protein